MRKRRPDFPGWKPGKCSTALILWKDKVKMQITFFFFFSQRMAQMTKSHFCEVKNDVNNATIPGLQVLLLNYALHILTSTPQIVFCFLRSEVSSYQKQIALQLMCVRKQTFHESHCSCKPTNRNTLLTWRSKCSLI